MMVVEVVLVQLLVKFLEEIVLSILVILLELFKSELFAFILGCIVDLSGDLVGL